MALSSADKVQLFYVYDPMCSWCWGYRPTWLALKQAIEKQFPQIEIKYLIGGLAPDSEQPMPIDMQQFLKQTWQKIAQQLGTQFNFNFWDVCQPRRSTYPACRACLIARASGQEEQMILAIQNAYYLEAKNPSDNSTLTELASLLGLDKSTFSAQLTAPSTQQHLMQEINTTHSLPIQGFPSLVLNINGSVQSIAVDYLHCEKSVEQISAALK